MLRRFEFVEGKWANFWQITRTGNSIELRYGRLGASGQLLEQILADEPAAIRQAERLIHAKLRSGYTEVRVRWPA